MSRNTGPCFEFELVKEGAHFAFRFLPGNVAMHIFEETRNAIVSLFDYYGIDAKRYCKKVTLEDKNNLSTIEIQDKKLIPVLKRILEARAFKNYKIKVIGEKDGNLEERVISTPLETDLVKDVIPYTQKHNNNLTSQRR